MRILVLAATAVVASALAATSRGAVASARTAHLTVSTATVFTVHGLGFKRSERVTVYATTLGSTVHVRVRATRTGAFTARFPTFTLPACPVYTVKAVGASGSRASFRVRTECAPGPTP